MSKRAHLHNLVRDMRRYLAWQKASGVIGFVPAGPEERALFDQKKKAREEEKLQALKEQLSGGSATREEKKSAKAPSAGPTPAAGPTPVELTPVGEGSKEASTPKAASGSAESAVTASTPLWKAQPAMYQMRQRRQERSKSKRPEPRQEPPRQERKAPPEDPRWEEPPMSMSLSAEPPPYEDEPEGRPASGPAPGPSEGYLTRPPQQEQARAPQRSEKKKEMSPAEKMAWLEKYLGDCRRCGLCESRKNLVFGAGDPQARLMFIGEGPGEEEDLQGLPFAGASGELLTKMIKAMGLSREEVYIANVTKCRPPKNREPRPEEIEECTPFLKKQIEVVEPEVIVTLGGLAAKALLKNEESLGRNRGRWHQYEGIALMPTFHPAYLVENQGNRELRKKAWSDLQQVMSRLGLK